MVNNTGTPPLTSLIGTCGGCRLCSMHFFEDSGYILLLLHVKDSPISPPIFGPCSRFFINSWTHLKHARIVAGVSLEWVTRVR
jgi:hypothetical protein